MRMNTLFTACLAAEVLMSLASFCVYAYDKRQAKTGGWRVPERTLLLLALAFGAPGALAGMRVMHHKTLKKRFTLTVPTLLVLQLALLSYLFSQI